MSKRRVIWAAAAWLALVPSAALAEGQAATGLAKPAWQPPRAEDVKEQSFRWLDQHGADQPTRAKAAAIWSARAEAAGEMDLLARLAATFALVDRNAAALVELCAKPKNQWVLPSQVWLRHPNTAPLVANNMRLLYGRWLAQGELYDEALDQLAGLEPGDVVAPATLLFYQGVAMHSLLDKQAGLKAIGSLLEGASDSPQRYVAVARLMQEDLKSLEDDSLDHIARRMNDVRRRLDLGRAGKKVRGVEDGIIESLDKMIKKVEEQQQNSSGSASVQDNIRSTSPAPDSVPIGGKGPGEVAKRNVGSQADWGDLPPKERDEALQKIGRDLPSHYRDIIEQYFRRLAAEEGTKDEGQK